MPPLEPGDRFPDLEVETPAGAERLSSRWARQPLVVMFMRHFGCTFCREQLLRMGKAHDDFVAAGAEVVAVFMYGADATAAFCGSRGVPFACVGDPTRAGYAEVSLGRGNRKQLLGWKVAKRYVQAIRAGATVGAGPEGADMAQLPGVFVIGRDGVLAYSHYAESSADNPPVEDVLGAVRGLAPRAASHGVSADAG